MSDPTSPIPAPASPAHPRAPIGEARKAEILSLAESTPHRTLIPVGEAATLVREIESLRARLDAAANGLADMHAIVNALPRTADGKPIVPGMQLFREFGLSRSIAELTAQLVNCEGNVFDGTAWFKASRFHSTAESALAARGREAGEGTSNA